MDIVKQVSSILMPHLVEDRPFLLALSGGPDSLCLFFCLLESQIPFHVAHVDHGWREESQTEASKLKQLAFEHGIPFHSKRLNPNELSGNLEDACRKERYFFFKEVIDSSLCSAVITGHQADDQAETLLKRIFEGSHWSALSALQEVSELFEIKVLRPLLKISKKEVINWLKDRQKTFFEDPTNQDPRFLRAKLRQTIFPYLNETFGKEVQPSLAFLGEEMAEVRAYFEERTAPLLNQVVRDSSGLHLDLKENLPESLLEIKFLLRTLCKKENITLSRSILSSAARALKEGGVNRQFEVGGRKIVIDRKRIYIRALS